MSKDGDRGSLAERSELSGCPLNVAPQHDTDHLLNLVVGLTSREGCLPAFLDISHVEYR